MIFNSYDQQLWKQIQTKSRTKYNALVERYNHPEEDGTQNQLVESSGLQKLVPEEAILDPLSNSWYGAEQDMNDEQLLDIINKDVERTFPDIEYFKDPGVQKSLTNILFIYAKLNPDVGYKQGMHELAAPMLWIVAQDSILEDESGVFDKAGVEADAFELFSEIMKSAKPWYMTDGHKQPPIVTKSVHIQEDLLQKADPELYNTLKSNSIEPQIWGIRWIRLIFGREFKFDQMLTLWDCLFASPVNATNEEEEDHLELVDYICVVMLLRVRARIIGAEHTDILTTLLNYPLDDQTAGTMYFYVTNASYLQRNLSPVGAKYVYDQYSHIFRPLHEDSDGFLSPRKGIDGLMDKAMDKAKVYSKTVLDQTQKWDMDKIVRQKFHDVRSKARTGLDQALNSKLLGDSARDEGLAAILESALAALETLDLDAAAKPALESIRHVQLCLRDPSLGVESRPSTPTASPLVTSSPIPVLAATGALSLGSPVSSPAQYNRRIRSKGALSSSPPTNLPRPSLSTSSRRNTLQSTPPESSSRPSTSSIANEFQTPTNRQNTDKPLFKSPARTSLAQSEFAWMISDVTTPPSKLGFTSSSTSGAGGATGNGSGSVKKSDLFELS